MAEKTEENDNVIFIGIKPFMNYITSVVMQFTTKNRNSVIIKARGRYIKNAIDVAEAVRKRFLKDKNLSVKEVKIDSEEMENKEGRKINVSAIEITLVR
ncbi:MAG: DNA-binding protein Alba [Nanoarchaeota archaeon]